MVCLKEEFKKNIKDMIPSEFENFIESYGFPCFKGISVNTLKITPDKLKETASLKLKPSPFSSNSFYIENSEQKLGNSPLHHAGAFYIQEPSAASAVAALDPKPFDKILDLCAAPGGKSCQIAARLCGTGLLWSNEVVRNRANILLSNIERMGIRNAVVSSCYPELLCNKLQGYFDKVLVDAPCSGEGMFRKNSEAINEWSIEHVRTCAKRQLAILESAKTALKAGGILVYSTCTFSKDENEKVIEKFLLSNKDFEIIEINKEFGRNAFKKYAKDIENIEFARRIFPQDGGEGHFVAKLRKKSHECNSKVKKYSYKRNNKEMEKFFYSLFEENLYGNIEDINNNYFILPQELPDLSGLNLIRAGVFLGSLRGTVALPEHAVFMAANFNSVKNKVNFNLNSNDIFNFLKGYEIEIPNIDLNSGFCAVAVDEIITGFGKYTNNKLKNHYPKGLRLK